MTMQQQQLQARGPVPSRTPSRPGREGCHAAVLVAAEDGFGKDERVQQHRAHAGTPGACCRRNFCWRTAQAPRARARDSSLASSHVICGKAA